METNMEHHNKIEHFIVQLERTKKFGRNWRVAGRISYVLFKVSLQLQYKSLFSDKPPLFFTQFPKLTSLPVVLASRRDLLAAAPAAVAPVMPGAPAQAAAKAEIAHNRSARPKCEKTF